MLHTILAHTPGEELGTICAVLVEAYFNYASEVTCPVQLLCESSPNNVSCFVPYGIENANTQGGFVEFLPLNQEQDTLKTHLQQLLCHKLTHVAPFLANVAHKRFFTIALRALQQRLDYESEHVQKAALHLQKYSYDAAQLQEWHATVHAKDSEQDFVYTILQSLVSCSALEQWRLFNVIIKMGQNL